MAVSNKKVSGKSAKKPVSRSSSKSAPTPSVSESTPAKRRVMTSSEIEAAAQKVSAEDVTAELSKPAQAETEKSVTKTEPTVSKESSAPSTVADEARMSKTASTEAPVAQAETKNDGQSDNQTGQTSATNPESVSKIQASSPAPKQTNPVNLPQKSPVAKSGAARPAFAAKPATAKSTAPSTSTKNEKANTVSTKSKTAATSKSAASSAPKKTTAAKAPAKKAAPKKAAAVSASAASKSAAAPTATATPAPAKPEAKTAASQPAAPEKSASAPAQPKPATAKTAEPKPAAETKQSDVFGFGALFMDGTAMEPYFELWKTPEVEAMVTAGNEAFEESVSAANEAFGKIFETMTGQADVFSGAGSRVAAQYEELLDTQKKSFEEVWQSTMAMFEKTGGIGTELSSWMQKEFEASQDDLDELTKVESLADLQELHTRIINRCYANSMAEGEKMQELMFSAISDGLNAMSKATNVTTK